LDLDFASDGSKRLARIAISARTIRISISVIAFEAFDFSDVFISDLSFAAKEIAAFSYSPTTAKDI
jgi:hypothetical protein